MPFFIRANQNVTKTFVQTSEYSGTLVRVDNWCKKQEKAGVIFKSCLVHDGIAQTAKMCQQFVNPEV